MTDVKPKRELCQACVRAGEIRERCPRCKGIGSVDILMKQCANPTCPRDGEPFNVYQVWTRSHAKYCSRECRSKNYTGVRKYTRRHENLRKSRMAATVSDVHIEHNKAWMQPGRRVLDRSRGAWGTLRPLTFMKPKRKDVGPRHLWVEWDDGELSCWSPERAAVKLHPGPMADQGQDDEILPMEVWLEGPS